MTRLIIRYLCVFLFAISAYASDFIRMAVRSGTFDVLRERHRVPELGIEYLFSPIQWGWGEFGPLAGITTTTRGSTYTYAGAHAGFALTKNVWITPSFSAGIYSQQKGKSLGFPLEFRSGLELAWKWQNGQRLGLFFYHLSNASLGRRNPGEESLVLSMEFPLSHD